jgi:phasin family protein
MNKTLTAAEQTGATKTPAKTLVETAVKSTNITFTKGLDTMANSARDFAAFGTANLEAVTASGQIWAAGVQDLTNLVASTAKSSYEESVATFKTLTAAKSVNEAMDLQTTYGKAAIANAMAMSKKLTDASIKLTEQSMAPLTARMAAAVESLTKAA